MSEGMLTYSLHAHVLKIDHLLTTHYTSRVQRGQCHQVYSIETHNPPHVHGIACVGAWCGDATQLICSADYRTNSLHITSLVMRSL